MILANSSCSVLSVVISGVNNVANRLKIPITSAGITQSAVIENLSELLQLNGMLRLSF